MAAIHLTNDLDKTVEQGNPHHHPHLVKVTKDRFNQLEFVFRPFNGTEPEPRRPRAISSDALPYNVSSLLSAEYDTAYGLWIDAKYVRTLKSTAAAYNVPAKWTAYRQARTQMDEAFQALSTTPDTRWNAAISRLVTVQQATREAAGTWDRAAREIAAVHYEHRESDLNWATAYELAGFDAHDWDVRDHHEYTNTYRTNLPLSGHVQDAISEQRAHLRTVASLTATQEH
ncbi:hypothetical protein ABZ829_27775 [Streptomyces xanthochromogenes]|uniref:hypothetical protein n=1 Tax=Streptomyces xanthochromogenes TaxID=67384 RepID=UPI0034474BD8